MSGKDPEKQSKKISRVFKPPLTEPDFCVCDLSPSQADLTKKLLQIEMFENEISMKVTKECSDLTWDAVTLQNGCTPRASHHVCCECHCADGCILNKLSVGDKQDKQEISNKTSKNLKLKMPIFKKGKNKNSNNNNNNIDDSNHTTDVSPSYNSYSGRMYKPPNIKNVLKKLSMTEIKLNCAYRKRVTQPLKCKSKSLDKEIENFILDKLKCPTLDLNKERDPSHERFKPIYVHLPTHQYCGMKSQPKTKPRERHLKLLTESGDDIALDNECYRHSEGMTEQIRILKCLLRQAESEKPVVAKRYGNFKDCTEKDGASTIRRRNEKGLEAYDTELMDSGNKNATSISTPQCPEIFGADIPPPFPPRADPHKEPTCCHRCAPQPYFKPKTDCGSCQRALHRNRVFFSSNHPFSMTTREFLDHKNPRRTSYMNQTFAMKDLTNILNYDAAQLGYQSYYNMYERHQKLPKVILDMINDSRVQV
ncbi:hypothetical protein SNEBB_007614 [Seison nebaliae]|nr:hypothetical protein SNEBB_007614 [Seison nebaliae]